MPGLDYAGGAVKVTGANVRSLAEMYGRARFYDGSPGRELVCCPDCGLDADVLFGDHGGTCVATQTPGRPAGSTKEAPAWGMK